MLSMKYLWKNAYATITGSESNVAAASNGPSCDSASPPIVNSVTICGTVISERSRTTINGQRTSFQLDMNVRIATVIMTGRANGHTMLKRMRISEHPSIRAASMSADGILKKNCRNNTILNALIIVGAIRAR